MLFRHHRNRPLIIFFSCLQGSVYPQRVTSLPMVDSGGDDIDAVRLERDFYVRLLEIGMVSEIEPFLQDALTLLTEIAGARRGYLELCDEQAGGEPLRFVVSKGCSDEETSQIRAALSNSIIAEALATGETVVLASALDDQHFGNRTSVRKKRIEAVLCAPIGEMPPNGVLYLQDRMGGGPFTENDRIRAERFVRHIAAFVDRLLMRRRTRNAADPTRPFRARLRADDVVGTSEALAATLKQASLAAPLDVSVLLLGASGTGKSQIARVIHESSARAGKPFVEVNCATLQPELVESELFGALQGAHSTATKKMEGKVAAAEGGTLFLDEVAELSPGAQAKLLQLLQSHEYYPLGSSKACRADIRVIAATNADLRDCVARKSFREDLYYRLQVLPIRLPSLAERAGDIPALAEQFCRRAVEMHRLPTLALSPGAVRAVQAAEWPGNLRQLLHTLEVGAIRAVGEGSLVVEREHLFPDALAVRVDALGGGQEGGPDADAPLTLQAAMRAFQKKLVKQTLERTDWNVTEAARILDITRAHIYNLIKAHGLDRASRNKT